MFAAQHESFCFATIVYQLPCEAGKPQMSNNLRDRKPAKLPLRLDEGNKRFEDERRAVVFSSADPIAWSFTIPGITIALQRRDSGPPTTRPCMT